MTATRYRFRQVAQMEWIKLRGLRSTWWALAAGLAAAAVIGERIGAGTRTSAGNLTLATSPATFIGLVIVSVLGVLTVTSEYGSGMIRTTLAATPRRSLVLAAKAAVFGAVALVAGEAASFLSYACAVVSLPPGVAAPGLSEPGVLRALILTGVGYCLLGLVGVGLGAIVRHTAGAVAIMIAGVFLLAQFAGKAVDLARYAPVHIVQDSLGTSEPLCGAGGCPDVLSPWAGLAMLALYAAIAVIVGGWLLVWRDA
jgi:ABC-2 type transport system permease protein